MLDIMVDLETLGNKPGCVVMSIGAVAFGIDGVADNGFYTVVDRKSCTEVGLKEDQSTLDWWSQQSAASRTVIDQASSGEGFPLTTTLINFANYLQTVGRLDQVRIWGNGSDFDNAILTMSYDAIFQQIPWKFYNNRCYRTLKSLTPNIPIIRSGTYHNAFDDAYSQAKHAVLILRELSK